jgi:hypothetical protein
VAGSTLADGVGVAVALPVEVEVEEEGDGAAPDVEGAGNSGAAIEGDASGAGGSPWAQPAVPRSAAKDAATRQRIAVWCSTGL